MADVCRRRDDVRLVLVGAGPLEEQVRSQVEACGLTDRVQMLGAVAHGRIPGLVAGLDIAVAPYAPSPEDFYFSPLKVAEYLAGGVPVVYSDLGDLQEMVGEAGVAVPAGDRRALSDAIDALASDPGRRSRHAQAARARAASLGWDTTARRLAQLCRTEMAALVR